jgi:N-acetylglucosaminyl-diphospho-decaprenol L-rhamnosyltransferase
MPSSASIDVVVVAYNSGDTLRSCVAPLAGRPGVSVTVVDNASPEPALDAVADLPVRAIAAPRNGGFAYGCNLGAFGGDAPYVLLLNPDARLEPADLDALARVLDDEPGTGLVGPRLLDGDGRLMYSQRRFPRVTSTFAQALFLHRIWPRALWADEVIRRAEAYDRPGSPEWVSGACMLVRRSLLERLKGLDEAFFLYSEDTDLCARVRAEGYDVRYEPGALARHIGGHSAPRSGLLAVLADSRRRYALKHYGPVAARLQIAGAALSAITHVITCARRPSYARGHLAALLSLLPGRSAGASPTT